MVDLFRYPTIEMLAKAIAEKRSVGGTLTAPSKPEFVVEQREHSLSRSQQRLWFLDQLDPGNAVYNIVSPVRLKGDLSVEMLEKSLKVVLQRHESLRTGFHERHGIPYAKVENADGWRIEFHDFSNIPAQTREDEILHFGQQEARRPFALNRGPLFRAVLLRAGPEEHVLILVMHHIIFDGWSMGVLTKRTDRILSSIGLGKRSGVAPIRYQFRDFVAWEQRQSGD